MSFKRVLSLLLSVLITAGSVSALAAEDILVSETPTVSVASEQAETPNSDIPTQVTAKAAKATNDIAINASSKNQTFQFGSPIALDITIKHPKNAPAGRAVVTISGYDTSVTKTISKNAKSSFAFRAVLQSKSAAADYPYSTGSYTIRAYTEVKEQGKWVRASSVRTTKLDIIPSTTVLPISQALFSTEGISFHFNFYDIGDGDAEDYPEGFFDAIVYRKASGNSKWVQTPFNIRSENSLVNTTYQDIDVKNGQKYTYSVKTALNGKWSKRSKSTSYYFLFRPQELTLKNNLSDKAITLSWSRNSKVSGYEVRYLTKPFAYYNENQAKKRLISGSKNTSLTLKNRTPGKQYYFQVRGYKTVNNKKYYSAWSDTILRYPD